MLLLSYDAPPRRAGSAMRLTPRPPALLSSSVFFLQDYVDSLKGLCYDGMEGLLYLSLYSFLSALAFTAILCSLPGAWRSFPR